MSAGLHAALLDGFMSGWAENGSVQGVEVDNPRSAALKAIKGLVPERDAFGDVPLEVTYGRALLSDKSGFVYAGAANGVPFSAPLKQTLT